MPSMAKTAILGPFHDQNGRSAGGGAMKTFRAVFDYAMYAIERHTMKKIILELLELVGTLITSWRLITEILKCLWERMGGTF